jgi:hypothetical protein
VLGKKLSPVLGQVNPIMLPITPAIQHTDGIWVNPGRNKKGKIVLNYNKLF